MLMQGTYLVKYLSFALWLQDELCLSCPCPPLFFQTSSDGVLTVLISNWYQYLFVVATVLLKWFLCWPLTLGAVILSHQPPSSTHIFTSDFFLDCLTSAPSFFSPSRYLILLSSLVWTFSRWLVSLNSAT